MAPRPSNSSGTASTTAAGGRPHRRPVYQGRRLLALAVVVVSHDCSPSLNQLWEWRSRVF
ncbi:hypothetical protein I553_1677 [Mycobacterium xenopi 4042]|uniref:Uncharacterized protein n=1 Tax=Mycobacterium xenopi 4042 TaxID=1299334 RepID=X8CEQ4_MYCXE|nr:hypothetical protein I553_1677 [Mycobacterium xenopi 4042]